MTKTIKQNQAKIELTGMWNGKMQIAVTLPNGEVVRGGMFEATAVFPTKNFPTKFYIAGTFSNLPIKDETASFIKEESAKYEIELAEEAAKTVPEAEIENLEIRAIRAIRAEIEKLEAKAEFYFEREQTRAEGECRNQIFALMAKIAELK